jgi:hypothetical protein
MEAARLEEASRILNLRFALPCLVLVAVGCTKGSSLRTADSKDGSVDKTDLPSMVGADVPGPSTDTISGDAGCASPKRIIYTTPGCGAEALSRCEVPNADACSMSVCLCDGVTISYEGCGWSDQPFLYTGACKKDGGLVTGDVAPLDVADGGGGVPNQPTTCFITAKLKPVWPDAGDAAMPAEHKFSMVIDWSANTATTGSGGLAGQVKLAQDNGTWTTQGTLGLSLALAGTDQGERPRVNYTTINIRPTADGCAGDAIGDYLWNSTDMLFTIHFKAELAGTSDTDGPAFSVFPKATTDVHPLALYGVAANEVLPAGTNVRWVAAGASVEMGALPATSTFGVSGFTFAGRALAFGTSYHLEILPAAKDLAGNQTLELPSITTIADPGMFAQDGFEGTLNAFIGGMAKIVDDTSLPVPAGHKALRFALPTGVYNEDWNCEDRFTARLAVPAGAKTVKLSYLGYWPKVSIEGRFYFFVRLAVPNGAAVDYSIYGLAADPSTTLPNPWTGTLPGSANFAYGELKQLELPLPAGIGSEVIFDVARLFCDSLFGSNGLIIDDLRVE